MVKIHTTVEISAAHIVHTTESDCSRMHGHNWKIEVTIDGTITDDGMVADFKDVKRLVRELDHKLLLPEHLVKVSERDGLKYARCIIHDKHYAIPMMDCELLPIDVITAENLAYHLWQVLNAELSLTNMVVRVYESEESWAESEGSM